MTETELRQLWRKEYCDPQNPVYTFDNIHVGFYEDMFDHAFFESANRIARDKSILSYNRLEKMLWIKDTLRDPEAMLKQGWNRDKKIYENGRRVALIKGNYVVVIRFAGLLKAKFVTAYEVQEAKNIDTIIKSPEWIREETCLEN